MTQSLHEFGINWTHSYTYYLQEFSNTVAVRFGDGHIEYYIKQKDGSFDKPDGMARKLTANADGLYQLMVDGIYKYTFGKDGMLQEIRDLVGNATTFSYIEGALSKVENSSGYLNFVYHADGSLRTVVDHTGRAVSYTYTNGLLTGFTDVEGNRTSYSYDSKNRLNQVVSPEKVVLVRVSYDSFDRVTEKIVRGSKYQYRYDDKERMITCTEPNGNVIKFQYTADYRIALEEDADGITQESKQAQENEQVSESTQKQESKYSFDNKKAVTTALAKKESAVTCSLSDVESQEKSTASNLLALKTWNVSACTGDQTFNTIYPQFQLLNTSGEEIALSDVTMRYYYTINGEKEQKFFCDWSSIGAQNVTGKFVRLANPVKGADYYLEVGFTSGAGKLSDPVDLHTRITKADWSDFIPGDDYSQNTSAVLSYFDQVDVFYKGELVWGKGGINGDEGENPPTEPEEPPVIPPITPPPVDPEEPPEENEEAEILPSGIDRLKLQMYNMENAEPFSGTIHPMMKLFNLGETMIPLNKVTIRYYYTKDNDKAQIFESL